MIMNNNVNSSHFGVSRKYPGTRGSKRNEEDIDVVSEMNKLIQLYKHHLSILKKKNEEKRKNAERRIQKRPSKLLLRQYENGRIKLLNQLIEKDKEDDDVLSSSSTYSYSSSKGTPSKISICERLYEEGMVKIRRRAEKPREIVVTTTPKKTKRRKSLPSNNDVCSRLYEQGMAKIMDRKNKELEKKSFQSTGLNRRNKEFERKSFKSTGQRDLIPKSTSSRLYKPGMAKTQRVKAKRRTNE